jgi:hypothetical protein
LPPHPAHSRCLKKVSAAAAGSCFCALPPCRAVALLLELLLLLLLVFLAVNAMAVSACASVEAVSFPKACTSAASWRLPRAMMAAHNSRLAREHPAGGMTASIAWLAIMLAQRRAGLQGANAGGPESDVHHQLMMYAWHACRHAKQGCPGCKHSYAVRSGGLGLTAL